MLFRQRRKNDEATMKEWKEKGIHAGYDEGVYQDKRLVEILDANGLKGTFNINTGKYQPEGKERKRFRMTRREIVDLFSGSAHEIAAHGYQHAFMESLHSSELLYEMQEERKQLEQDFGTIIRGFAYPYGR